MQKLIPILLILFVFAISGCREEFMTKNTPADVTGDKTADTKDEGKDSETKEPAETKVPKISASPEDIEKIVGKPGKFKIMYYHLGECYTCQENIVKFEMVSLEHAEDFEFFHYLGYEIEQNGLDLADFGINEMTAPTGYIFDNNNRLVWMQADPEFKDFIKALKNAGLKKEVIEPELPPDYFEQPH